MTKAKAVEILNEAYDGFLIAEKVCSDAFKDEITDRKIALLTAIDALEQSSSVEAELDKRVVMDDYISREEVVKEIKSRIFAADEAWESGYNTAMAGIMEWIKHMPTADGQPVKQDTELSIILQDYGIKDTDTLRYILDQYQKIIVDITGGQMSYLTYPAETVIACADDNYHKCYEESMNHGRWVWDSNAPHRDYGAYKCNNCGYHSDFEENYCPNCGCKQDLDGDRE